MPQIANPIVMTYPALYTCADAGSTEKQSWYFTLILAEYTLLGAAAILSMTSDFLAYALVLVFSLGIMLWRSFSKPEQDWYRCRALAESVKTSTWRYIMRAEPFSDAEPTAAKAKFRSYLSEVLRTNEGLGALAAGIEDAGKHTTDEMEAIRRLPWKARRDYYLTHRIDEQCGWYKRKSGFNRTRSAIWVGVAVIVYAAAIALAIARPTYPNLLPFWPIEPLLVGASFVIGWTQIKKFNELSSVYALTALEVQLIHEKIKEVDQESELPLFVNEAELAFSREHTQWVARQSNAY
jgi:hypothetical protein